MSTIKVTNFTVENYDLQLPTQVSLVDGLDEEIDAKLTSFNATTITQRLNGLSTVYLAKDGKAVSAAKADSCTTAVKATQDGSGNVITSTYLTKTGTAAKAESDGNGLNIANNYVKVGAPVDKAASCTTALKATQDDSGANIRSTYLKGVGVSTDGSKLQVTSGSGVLTTYDLPKYGLATAAAMGLMSASDKEKLDTIDWASMNFFPENITNSSKFGFNVDNIDVPGFYYINFYQNAAWQGQPVKHKTSSSYLIVYSGHSWAHYKNRGEYEPCFQQIMMYTGAFMAVRARVNGMTEFGPWREIPLTEIDTYRIES